MITTNGTYPWSFVIHIFRNRSLAYGGDHAIVEVMIST